MSKDVEILVDVENFYCDNPPCGVLIFIGCYGVCPACDEVGVRVGNAE